jgi:hypothetical protein
MLENGNNHELEVKEQIEQRLENVSSIGKFMLIETEWKMEQA